MSDDPAAHPGSSDVPPAKRRLLVALLPKLAVGVALVVVLAWLGGFEACWAALSGSRPLPLIVAAGLLLVSLALGALGVLLIGRAVSDRLTWVAGLKGFLFAWVLGFFVGRISEFSLPVFWRHSLTLGQGAAVVLVDKAISLLWVVVLGAAGLSLFFGRSAGLLAAAFAGGGLLLMLLLVLLPQMRGLAARVLPEKLLLQLSGLGDTLRGLGVSGRRAVFGNFLLTGVRSVAHGAMLVALVVAVDRSVDLGTAVVIQAQTQLASLIPGTVMGLGTWESVYVLSLGRVGIGAATAVAISLLGRVVSLAVVLPVLLFAWHRRD